MVCGLLWESTQCMLRTLRRSYVRALTWPALQCWLMSQEDTLCVGVCSWCATCDYVFHPMHLQDISPIEALALEIVSYIGCGISIVCLLLTVIFFLTFGYVTIANNGSMPSVTFCRFESGKTCNVFFHIQQKAVHLCAQFCPSQPGTVFALCLYYLCIRSGTCCWQYSELVFLFT